MHNYFWFYVLGTIGIALLVFMLPMFRQQLAKSNLPLEQRYAKEIANGEAVIIPKDPAALKKLVQILISAGIFILLFQEFRTYISFLYQTCTRIGIWDVFLIYLAIVSCLICIGSLLGIIFYYKSYKKILLSGYFPSLESRYFRNRIAFKLTKKIKIKEQLKLAVSVIACIYIMTSPFQILYIILYPPSHQSMTLHDLNKGLHEVCLDDLKNKK